MPSPSRTSRSAARSSAPPRRCGRSKTARCATISGGTIARLTSWWPALALPGVAVTDDALYSLQVFTNILGGGMSSRLFQEARERRGLCYSIYSFHIPYSDTGMFGLYAGTDAADTAELMRVIVGEIAGTADTISEPEIARSKAQ